MYKMNKSFRQDVVNRVISGLSSAALLVLMGQQLGVADFARLQINLTYGALIYWACDFGLIGLAYIYLVQSNFEGFASCWKMRQFLLTIATVILLILLTLSEGDRVEILLVLIGILESFIDSNLPIRQFMRSALANNLSITFRKASQLTLFLSVVYLFDSFSLMAVVYIYSIPSAAVLLADACFFGKYPGNFSIHNFKKSTKYFLQSSGTNIASLDLLLISKFGFIELIYPYSIAKKFYSFLMIPGTTFLRISMIDKFSEDKTFRMFISSLRSALMITFIATLLAYSLFSIHSTLFIDERKPIGVYLLILSLIFLPTLGAISTNLNGVLVSKSRYRFAAVSTFLSSFVYLLTIYCGFALGLNQYFVLVFAIYVNLICEIWFEYKLLFTKFAERKFINASLSGLISIKRREQQ